MALVVSFAAVRRNQATSSIYTYEEPQTATTTNRAKQAARQIDYVAIKLALNRGSWVFHSVAPLFQPLSPSARHIQVGQHFGIHFALVGICSGVKHEHRRVNGLHGVVAIKN